MTDNILMCSENWTELLRSELREELVYSSCILWTNRGFERAIWSDVLRAQFPGTMESDSKFTSV